MMGIDVTNVKRPRLSIKQAEILLWITPVVQIALAVMYVFFVTRPFYLNGLDQVPIEEIESGLYDPAYLYPFCYTPPDAPDDRASRCADGTKGNPNGRLFSGWAVTTACLGPWIGGAFTVVSTMSVLRCWDQLRRTSRWMGMISVLFSFGTFVLMSHRGYVFLIWLLD